jgi:hypothetical protein
VDNGDAELRQKRACFSNVRTSCNTVSFLTYYDHTPVDSKRMPELQQIPDDPKNEGLIFTMHQQTRCAEERLVRRLKESRQINWVRLLWNDGQVYGKPTS